MKILINNMSHISKIRKYSYNIIKQIIKKFIISFGIITVISIPFGILYLNDDYQNIVNIDSDNGVLNEKTMLPYNGTIYPLFSGYSGKFKNGIKDGKHLIYDYWHFYGIGGSLLRIEEYNNGIRNGRWTSWYSIGNLKSTYKYRNGKLSGLQEHWNIFGELTHLNYNENDISSWVFKYLKNSKSLQPIEGLYIAIWDDYASSKYAIIKHRSQLVAITMEPYKSTRFNNDMHQYVPGDIKFSLKQQGGRFTGTYFYTHNQNGYLTVERQENSSIINFNDTSITWEGGKTWKKVKR